MDLEEPKYIRERENTSQYQTKKPLLKIQKHQWSENRDGQNTKIKAQQKADGLDAKRQSVRIGAVVGHQIGGGEIRQQSVQELKKKIGRDEKMP